MGPSVAEGDGDALLLGEALGLGVGEALGCPSSLTASPSGGEACPKELSPQHVTAPVALTAHPCWSPTSTST